VDEGLPGERPGVTRRAVLHGSAAFLVLSTIAILAASQQSAQSPAAASATGLSDRPTSSPAPSASVAYTKTRDVLVLHRAQGLTPGVRGFARRIENAGHMVHVPDLYDGRTFTTLERGLDHANQIGIDTTLERGVRAAAELPADLAYVGFSLGVLPAQQLAQTRTGAQACVTLAACADPGQFGTGWPIDEPVQIHGMDHDPYFAGEGDVDNARQLVHDAHHGQLFLYPGDHHLFTDRSLPSYDPVAATQVVSRVLHFPSTY
jgi:dienelactone hydrolase